MYGDKIICSVDSNRMMYKRRRGEERRGGL